MIWLLPAIGAFIYGIWYIAHDADELIDYIFAPLIGTVLAMLVGLMGLGIGSLIGLAAPTLEVALPPDTLITIRDKDGVSGRFFLGTGTIKGEQYYFYYKAGDAGAVIPRSLSASKAIAIYEDATESTARVQMFVTQATSSAWDMLAIVWPNERYEFHVPPNTIKRGFEM